MHNKFAQILQKELQGDTHEKAPQNNAKKTSENDEKNAEKIQGNATETTENALKNDLDSFSANHESDHKAAHNGSHEENDDNAFDDDEDDTFDDEELGEDVEDYINKLYDGEFDDDLDDPDDIPEIHEDPLDKKFVNEKTEEEEEEEEPEKVKIEDIKEKAPSSPRNNKNIEKLGLLILGRADILKAKACSRISGQHMAEYTADEELKVTLIEAIKEYLATQEFSAPTPFGTLMIAVALWALPPIGLAFWHKYELKKETPPQKTKPSTTGETVTIEVEEKAQDYSHLKEFKDGRKVFNLHKEKGTYNRTQLGQFIKTEIADELPSPQVKEWIDQGYSNKKIRTLLYGT